MMNLKEFSAFLTTCSRPELSAVMLAGFVLFAAGVQPVAGQTGIRYLDGFTPVGSGWNMNGITTGSYQSAERDTVPHPRKVMFRSLILPGWGQVTNRQIWKVPLVYAMLGGLTYYSIYSHNEYSDYRAAYYNAASGNDDLRFGPTPPRLAGVPPESLRFNRNFFRNRRDFTFIIIGVAYGLNVLDAYIFAHFRDFDVSDDLARAVIVHPDPFGNPVFSVRYRIRF